MEREMGKLKEIEGIIIGISEEKQKQYQWGTYLMRYVAVETPDIGRVLIRLQEKDFNALPRDKDGRPTRLLNGNIAKFASFSKQFTFDNGEIMLTNPKYITVMGDIKEKRVERYPLSGIEFFDWGVSLRNGESKCIITKEEWNAQTGLETSLTLLKYKKKIPSNEQAEAYVEVMTTFNIRYIWDFNRVFFYHPQELGSATIISENLLPLKKVKTSEEEIFRTRMLLDEIRQILQRKIFVTEDDLKALAQKYTIPEKEVAEYVRAKIWHKSYDEAFTNHLKSKTDKILYGEDGLFFCLPGSITILEEPQPNKASYIFIGDPNFIASQIEAIKRENQETDGRVAWRELLYRLKKSDPNRFIWFIGRVYHIDEDQWKRDVDLVLAQANAQAPDILPKIPTDPTKYNTSAVAHIPKGDNNNA